MLDANTTDNVSARAGRRDQEFDKALGNRVRFLRVGRKLSQTDLGAAVNVSFQQIQKYEKGKDRISAATLQKLARTLDVPITQFFEEGEPPTGSPPELRALTAIAGDMARISHPKVRKALVALIAEVARFSVEGTGA